MNLFRLLPALGKIVVLLLFTGLEVVLAGRAPVQPSGGTEQMQMLAAIMRARDVLPFVSGLGFLISPLVVGLFAGASVSVWRALKDEPALDIAV